MSPGQHSDMQIEIKLPELGENIESGDVAAVLVNEGDRTWGEPVEIDGDPGHWGDTFDLTVFDFDGDGVCDHLDDCPTDNTGSVDSDSDSSASRTWLND